MAKDIQIKQLKQFIGKLSTRQSTREYNLLKAQNIVADKDGLVSSFPSYMTLISAAPKMPPNMGSATGDVAIECISWFEFNDNIVSFYRYSSITESGNVTYVSAFRMPISSLELSNPTWTKIEINNLNVTNIDDFQYEINNGILYVVGDKNFNLSLGGSVSIDFGSSVNSITTWVSDSNYLIVRSVSNHYLRVGDIITISGTSSGGVHDGTHTIYKTISATEFLIPANGNFNTSKNGTVTHGAKSFTDITDNGSGTIKISGSWSTSYDWKAGEYVVVSGTTNYNGSYLINSVGSGFVIVTATYVSNQSGTITINYNKSAFIIDSNWNVSGIGDEIGVTDGFTSISNHLSRLVLTNKNDMYLSKIYPTGIHTDWTVDAYSGGDTAGMIRIDNDNTDKIMSIKSVNNRLVIIRQKDTYIMSGETILGSTMYSRSGELGANSKGSVVIYKSGVIFNTINGYVYIDSSTGEELFIDQDVLRTSIWTYGTNGLYSGNIDSFIYKNNLIITGSGCFIYDFDSKAWHLSTLNYNLNSFNGKLYGMSPDLYVCSTTKPAACRIMTGFSDLNSATFYKTINKLDIVFNNANSMQGTVYIYFNNDTSGSINKSFAFDNASKVQSISFIGSEINKVFQTISIDIFVSSSQYLFDMQEINIRYEILKRGT